MWLSDWFKEFFHKADMVLLSLILAASLFGVALIYSATRYLGMAGARFVPIQLVAIALGVAAYFVMSFVDVELFTERSWKWMFVFNVFIILLLKPFGVGGESTGNNSWLPIPFLPINVQPAEVAKVFFILLLAFQCRKLQDWGISRFSSVVQLAGHTLFMAGLIATISGDFGMSLVYLGLFVIMSWTAGVKKRWFLLGLILCAVVAAVAWPHISDMYFARRITAVVGHLTGDPNTLYEQTQGAGWQQTRSILAIGSGGLFGQGYLQGTQTHSTSENALNARYTDEIFAVCGEELGMVGCLFLILLLAAIILRCVYVARRANSPMSAYIAMGYAAMLLLQTCINIGMCLYVFPVVGLTLPFISYGGTSIITLYACMGIVSGIKMRSLPSWLRDRNQLGT